jgi:YVTN family beta-propeller protein
MRPMGGYPQYRSTVTRAVPGRRSFLAGAAAFLAGCGHSKGTGFPGYAFVANREGRSVSAVDLTAFRVARRIGLDSEPVQAVAHPARPLVYILCPDSGDVIEIDAASLARTRTARVGASAVAMRMAPEGDTLWVLCREPRGLVPLPLSTFRPAAPFRLPAPPRACDIQFDQRRAAVLVEQRSDALLVSLDKGGVERSLAFAAHPDIIRFRSDGRLLIAGHREPRSLSMVDTGTGNLLVELPLAVAPEHFSVVPDGGQLFVTGAGSDAVAIVFPYRTEVAETLLAGRAPSAMGVTGDGRLLFMASPGSNEVSVLEIRTRKLIAVVAVGAEPDFISFTPDDQYALVLNRRSGDMAVIRVAAVLDRRTKTAPLFTIIPVGSQPVSVAVRRV